MNNTARPRVIAFVPGLYNVTYGSSIRSHYLLIGLAENGLLVNPFERDFVSKTAVNSVWDTGNLKVFTSNAKFPISLAKSKCFFFEGLPTRPVMTFIPKWAKLSGRRILLDVCDDPILQYKDLVGQHHPRASQLFSIREKFLELSDQVIFPSKSLKECYLKRD